MGPRDWKYTALFSPLLAGILFAAFWSATSLYDLVSGRPHPVNSFWDVYIALLVCPGITFIAIAGWARSLVSR
jgi:hypothetical protein